MTTTSMLGLCTALRAEHRWQASVHVKLQCSVSPGFLPLLPLHCRSVEQQMANLECNAVSAVHITHLLLGRMRAKKLRGCFVYTSSGLCACV